MTRLKGAVQGDVNDERVVALDGVDSLANVSSIAVHVWRPGVDVVTLTATVLDADERTITIPLGATAEGWLGTIDLTPMSRRDYFVEYQVTWADGTVLTFPAEGYDTLPVRTQGA